VGYQKDLFFLPKEFGLFQMVIIILFGLPDLAEKEYLIVDSSVSCSQPSSLNTFSSGVFFFSFVKMQSGPKGVVRRKNARRPAEQKSGGLLGAFGGQNQQQMFRLADDNSGLKVGPTAVMIMSVGFILVVLLFHIFGKIFGNSGNKQVSM